MGLAPYGEPKYVELIYDHLIDLQEDGSFRLNQKYFDYLAGLTMTNGRFDELFGGPPRVPETKLTQREMDLARSVQEVCEEVMLRMARTAHRRRASRTSAWPAAWRSTASATAGCCAKGPFKRLWIQPAAGDAGGALGVAQLIWHRHCKQPRRVTPGKDAMKGAYLGPGFTRRRDRGVPASRSGAVYQRLERPPLLETVARLLADEKIVGWFDGRMEFGPRALGLAQHPRRSAQPADAGADEHQDQVPRGLPAVRAERAAGAGRATTSSWTATRRTCCWWRRSRRSARSR